MYTSQLYNPGATEESYKKSYKQLQNNSISSWDTQEKKMYEKPFKRLTRSICRKYRLQKTSPVNVASQGWRRSKPTSLSLAQLV